MSDVDRAHAIAATTEVMRVVEELLKENASAQRRVAELERDYKLLGELEHEKRREAEAELAERREQRVLARERSELLTGYVTRLREALIAHTPPMFMREVEALLKETENV